MKTLKSAIKMINTNSYKIGVNEIDGLKMAMKNAMGPLVSIIQEKMYWTTVELTEAEYKSRDGFIPSSHNCGGIMIREIIPSIERHEFSFLEFGNCVDCDALTELNKNGEKQLCGHNGVECANETEGYLDASFRVWLKFEGLNEKGGMDFYLVASGGNNDAPYFREQYMGILFEEGFSAQSVKQFETIASATINKMLKKLNLK